MTVSGGVFDAKYTLTIAGAGGGDGSVDGELASERHGLLTTAPVATLLIPNNLRQHM